MMQFQQLMKATGNDSLVVSSRMQVERRFLRAPANLFKVNVPLGGLLQLGEWLVKIGIRGVRAQDISKLLF